jgi:outer membrane immunogenic protein
MKTLLVAAAAAIAAVTAQPATAADMPVKAPPPVVEVWTWDGWYAGINGGYSWGRSETTGTFYHNVTGALLATSQQTIKLNGPIFGGQIGFNRQRGNWVWGLEADGQWSGQKGDGIFSCPVPVAPPGGPCNPITAGAGAGVAPTATFNQKLEWFVTLRGRLGVLVQPNWLAYATGGLAIGHIETNGVLSGFTGAQVPTSASFSYDNTKFGWTVGGGIEGRLSRNWTAKLEYIYADYGTVSGTAFLLTANPPLRVEFDSRVTDHVLRVGLNYKWGPAVVVARN